MEKNELQEMLFNDLGEDMNRHFTKEQMVRFYKLLKKVHKIVLWQNTIKHGFFNFEEVMYISGKKFKVRASNVKPGNITGDYYEDDRFPAEILVTLPLENELNGLKNNTVILKSEGSLLGGMNYKDFMDFLSVYRSWIFGYKKSIYAEANTPEETQNDFPILVNKEKPSAGLLNKFSQSARPNLFNLKEEGIYGYNEEEDKEYYNE